ncbi:MAG: hypothetical protein AAB361_01130 [Patescibacteria group bacterium]
MFEDLTKKTQEKKAKENREKAERRREWERRAKERAERDFPDLIENIKKSAACGETSATIGFGNNIFGCVRSWYERSGSCNCHDCYSKRIYWSVLINL